MSFTHATPHRQVIDSECHPLAQEFLCELVQPDCRRAQTMSPSGVFEDLLVSPCRDFCEEVMSVCASSLPPRLKRAVNCSALPTLNADHECTTKPGEFPHVPSSSLVHLNPVITVLRPLSLF